MVCKTPEQKIADEIKHLEKKIASLEKKLDNDTVDECDASEDLANWNGWKDALTWVQGGCKRNPHKGDGY